MNIDLLLKRLKGKTWAYHSMGGRIVIVVKGEPGYWPVYEGLGLSVLGDDDKVDSLNTELGLTKQESFQIVFDSLKLLPDTEVAAERLLRLRLFEEEENGD